MVSFIEDQKKERKKRMNDLFSSRTFSRRRSEDLESGPAATREVQMAAAAAAAGGANLDKFFEDVEAVKEELREVEAIHRRLHESNESSKTLHAAAAVRALRATMDADVAAALRRAKLIKLKLEALDRSNAANRSVPGCGPGSSSDRTRTSVVAGLRKKLADATQRFQSLRDEISSEYRDTVQRRY